MPLRLALAAMATRFELVLEEEATGRDGGLAGDAAVRAAGEAALEEIRAVERSLSHFRRDALPARVERAAREPDTQRCGLVLPREEIVLLETCRRACERSGGAFDPALGDPPLSTWTLDRRSRCVRPPAGSPRVDFGGVGKGHALDLAVRELRAAGIERALLHGGTSSVAALGAPPGASAWRVALRDPLEPGRRLATVALRDASLSVSAPHGRVREVGGKLVGHVIDPRDGSPVERARLAAVVARHGAVAEAWSTALLVLAERRLRAGAPPARDALPLPPSLTALLAWEEASALRVAVLGRRPGLFRLAPRPRSAPRGIAAPLESRS